MKNLTLRLIPEYLRPVISLYNTLIMNLNLKIINLF